MSRVSDLELEFSAISKSRSRIDQFPNYTVSADGYVINSKNGKHVGKPNKNDGYVRIQLHSDDDDRICYTYVHRLVALAFDPSDDPKLTQVDHKDHDRNNNSLNNLRWVTERQNMCNRNTDVIVDDISDDAIEVESYGEYTFEFTYFDQKTNYFYFFNGINYKQYTRKQSSAGAYYSQPIDVNGKPRYVQYNKFKNEHNLI
jgi:hypothetical protein